MPFDIGALGQQAAGDVVGTGLGLLLEKHNDKRQLEQQQKLTDMQLGANMKMSDYNYAKQLQMWHDTNFSAQMQEMEKAGINPALIYGTSGGGATTIGSGSGGGGISAGEAPHGGHEIMDIANQQKAAQIMQLELMQAQKQNIEADTANKQADTQNKPLVGENIQASTASITQGIKNQQTEQQLKEAMITMQNLQNTITGDTLENTIAKINTETQNAYQALRSAQAQGDFDQSTLNDRINTVKTQAIGAILQNDLTKAKTSETRSNIQVNSATINKMAQDIVQRGQEISINTQRLTNVDERNAETNRMQQNLQEYIHNMPDSWKVSQEAIGGMIHIITGNLSRK